jgi:UPF0716 protein FxsA
MSLRWIIAAILGLPVAELVVYLAVAAQIGFLWAFALQLVCSAAGVMVLRQAGRVRFARWKAGVAAGGIAGVDASAGGGAIVLGGILLVIPGFITDLVGVCLLVPPLRRGLGAVIRRVMERYGRTRDPGKMIDLPPEEWREIKTRKRINRRARPRRGSG